MRTWSFIAQIVVARVMMGKVRGSVLGRWSLADLCSRMPPMATDSAVGRTKSLLSPIKP